LFIKLAFILNEKRRRMVNAACVAVATRRERRIKRPPPTLAVELVGQEMAEPRKIFRIEETAASRLTEGIADAQAPLRHAELMAELSALRALITAAAMRHSGKIEVPAKAESERLTSELNLIVGAIGGTAMKAGAAGLPCDAPPMTRVAHELEEVVNSTEQATQRVLAAAEEIDQVAKNLSAALTGKFEQGLAQDIVDLVIRIFEACNFQDLTGQRITKVLSILNFVEDHVARVLEDIARDSAAAPRDGVQYLHGPRLHSDSGHVNQAEIDAMFGG
jgi:chemotaxis protein CheZ